MISAPEIRKKLFRCLELAQSQEKLGCHIGSIIDAYVESLKGPEFNNPLTEAWVDYFLKMNTPKETGAHQLRLTCPRCGDHNWIERDDGWECVACGEFSYQEDMCSEVVDALSERVPS